LSANESDSTPAPVAVASLLPFSLFSNMATDHGTQSPQIPASLKYHHPYFTPAEIDYLSEKQRGKLSITQEEKVRQNACGFLEAIGTRIGL